MKSDCGRKTLTLGFVATQDNEELMRGDSIKMEYSSEIAMYLKLQKEVDSWKVQKNCSKKSKTIKQYSL